MQASGLETAGVEERAFLARHQPFIEFMLGLGIVLALCALLAMVVSYNGDTAATLGETMPRPSMTIPVPSWYRWVSRASYTTYQRKLLVRFDNGEERWIRIAHCPESVWIQPMPNGRRVLAIGP